MAEISDEVQFEWNYYESVLSCLIKQTVITEIFVGIHAIGSLEN